MIKLFIDLSTLCFFEGKGSKIHEFYVLTPIKLSFPKNLESNPVFRILNLLGKNRLY